MPLLNPQEAGSAYRHEKWSQFDFEIRSMQLQDDVLAKQLLERIADLSLQLDDLGKTQEVLKYYCSGNDLCRGSWEKHVLLCMLAFMMDIQIVALTMS